MSNLVKMVKFGQKCQIFERKGERGSDHSFLELEFSSKTSGFPPKCKIFLQKLGIFSKTLETILDDFWHYKF